MAKNKTTARASRDLFSVSLDFDIILFKLANIEEDLKERGHNIRELDQLDSLKRAVKYVQDRADKIRKEWENGKQ